MASRQGETPRVLVVDDQAAFRRAAGAVCDAAGFALAGEAVSGEEGVSLASTLRADIVLMDINLPGINGIEATRRILADRPGAIVLLLSTYRVEDLPEEAQTCGAAAYVHKEDLGPEVLQDAWAGRSPRRAR